METIKVNYNGETKYTSEWITEQKLADWAGWYIDNMGQAAEATKETEKAIRIEVRMESRYTDTTKFVQLWIPKSQLRDTDEGEERMDRIANAYAKGCENYAKLVEKVTGLGIKIRKRSRTETIVKKVQEAGQFEAIADMVKMTKYGWKLA